MVLQQVIISQLKNPSLYRDHFQFNHIGNKINFSQQKITEGKFVQFLNKSMYYKPDKISFQTESPGFNPVKFRQ